MEIVTLVFAAIGAIAIVGVIYITVRQIHDNSTEIDNLKQWNRRQGEAIDKNAERFFTLQNRVDDIEDMLANGVADMIKPKRRK